MGCCRVVRDGPGTAVDEKNWIVRG
jgi:hypothetical protein